MKDSWGFSMLWAEGLCVRDLVTANLCMGLVHCLYAEPKVTLLPLVLSNKLFSGTLLLLKALFSDWTDVIPSWVSLSGKIHGRSWELVLAMYFIICISIKIFAEKSIVITARSMIFQTPHLRQPAKAPWRGKLVLRRSGYEELILNIELNRLNASTLLCSGSLASVYLKTVLQKLYQSKGSLGNIAKDD